VSVLTLGKTMALFDPVSDGVPRSGMSYMLRFADFESNFAIASEGVDIRWVTHEGSAWTRPGALRGAGDAFDAGFVYA
jgi:hypothetical protein